MSIDLQEPLFRWATSQPVSTGCVMFVGGILYGFHGYRFLRPLLVLTNAILGGALLGSLAAAIFELPVAYATAAGAAGLGLCAMRWRMVGSVVGSAAAWGLLAAYLAAQLSIPTIVLLPSAISAAMIGGTLALLCVRTMRVVLMALQGSALLVVGFVGASAQIAPSMGLTFCSMASSYGLLVPVLLAMLITMTVAYQSNYLRGDIQAGVSRS